MNAPAIIAGKKHFAISPPATYAEEMFEEFVAAVKTPYIIIAHSGIKTELNHI